MHQESLLLVKHMPYFTFVIPSLELFDSASGWRELGFGTNGVVYVVPGFAVIVAWGSRPSNVRICTLRIILT